MCIGGVVMSGWGNWIKANFLGIFLAIYAFISFNLIIFPFLVRLQVVNFVLNIILVNSRNIKLILGVSSIIQIFFILFGKMIVNFISRLNRTPSKSYFLSKLFPFLLFFILSMISFKQYPIFLSIIWRLFVFLISNLFLAFLTWQLYNLIGLLSNQFKYISEPLQTERQLENILTDDPITSQSEDLLDRGKFVEDLYDEIVNFPYENSIVFGLYGGWGEGKTSTLNLLKSKFNNNSKFLVLDFKPWYFKDKESILKAFYNQLEDTIGKNFVIFGFSKLVNKYLQYISLGKNIRINIGFPNVVETPVKMKENIEKELEKLRIKLLIIIDDLDRLQTDEVLQIFNLVKCNADLKNTIFILSFDPIVIEKLLQKELNSDKEYLEKIVQIPINLPSISSDSIGNFLKEKIEKLLERIKISDDDKKDFYDEFSFTYMRYILKCFKTLRHVKRYINGLSTTLPAIKSEVNLSDFFVLEAIRILYPSIYYDIWINKGFYVPIASEFNLTQLGLGYDLTQLYSGTKEHVESILKEVLFKDREESKVLLELLKKIFPVTVGNAFSESKANYAYYEDTFRTKKRITHPDCFVKYFTLTVPPSELSDEYVEKIIDEWNALKEEEKIRGIEKTLFMFQDQKKLEEFLTKLKTFNDRINKDSAICIIRAIYININKFSKAEIEHSWNSDYDNVLQTLLLLINSKIDNKEITNIIEEVINCTPSIPFAVEVVWRCKKGATRHLYNIYESTNFDKLVDVISDRLKKYFIEEKRDIFSELFDEKDFKLILYQWATDWMTFKGKNKDIVNNYLFSLVKDDSKKFTKFLTYLGTKEVDGTMNFDFEQLAQAYYIDKIVDLAEEFKRKSDLSSDEREVLERFLKLWMYKNLN